MGNKKLIVDSVPLEIESDKHIAGLVNICLVGLLMVGLLVLPLFIMRIGKIGWNFGSITHIIILVAGGIFILFRKHIPLTTRAIGLLGISFLSAFSALLTYGIVGSGFFGMGMMSSIIAATALGRTPAFIMLGLTSGSFLWVLFSVFSGDLVLGANIAVYVQTKTAWFMALSGFILPIIMLILGINEMHLLLKEFIKGKIKSSQEIEEKNVFLESLFASSDSFFIVIDEALKILQCNVACLKATGYSNDEVIGKNFVSLFFLEEEYTKVSEEFSKNTIRNREDIWQTKDARILTINWNNSLIKSSDKNKQLWLVSGIDVSGQKLLEKKISHSEKMQSIGQLAGGVAHDFNNMLAGIVLSAELLGLHHEDEASKKYVAAIMKASKQASQLTSKLLNFSRRDSGVSELLDLNTLVTDSANLINLGITKNVKIKTELNEMPIIIRGNSSQIVNAILNLGINARDAMTNGGTITISSNLKKLEDDLFLGFEDDIEPGYYAEVVVADSGEGIAKENLDKIFEPFFTTKEMGKGTGLGLASVYGTVKNHKGTVRVYSEVGEGTVFRLYFPCEMNIKKDEKAKASFTVDTRSLSILLVDDDENIREATANLLVIFKNRVTVVENGKKALDLLANNSDFDLVILDWIMPIMGGKETIGIIQEKYPNISVLLVSGFAPDLESIQQDIDSGKVKFLSKPYAKEELLKIIAEI